jgi:hypothetical protein
MTVGAGDARLTLARYIQPWHGLRPTRRILYETAQFVVPRAAGDAIDVAQLVRQAADAGVIRPRLEMNTKNAGGGRVRITCRVIMALRLTEKWTEIGVSAPRTEQGTRLAAECAIAVVAAFKACEDAQARHEAGATRRGRSGWISPDG